MKNNLEEQQKQYDLMKAYALREGWEIVKEYPDLVCIDVKKEEKIGVFALCKDPVGDYYINAYGKGGSVDRVNL